MLSMYSTRSMANPIKLEKKDSIIPHQSIPKFWLKELPKEQMDYFLILDFEANQNTRYPDAKEIIEFPVLKLSVKTLEIESTFHTYVQPTMEPYITAFITDLTGIRWRDNLSYQKFWITYSTG